MRVALYARVSTEAQEARGNIGSQVEALRAHASHEGHEIAAEYLDDGVSGARLDRPGLDALRDAAEAGLIEAVLCLSPDRLARAYAYQVIVLDELARHGVPVLFSDAPLLDDDPQSRLLTQVQGVIAEYERAKIAERYRRGRLYRARQGEIVTWKPPYGFRRVPREGTRPAHLEVYEPEAAVVRRIFDETVSREISMRQTVRHLATDGVPSPTGKAIWGHSTIARVLRNEAYIGRVYYNRTRLVPSPPGSKNSYTQRARPREEWIPIRVPRIVSDEVFEAAQNVSRDNSKWSPRRAEPGAWLLRGLVKCGRCGVGTACHKMRGRNGTWHRYYYCTHHDVLRAGGEAKRCTERNIRANELDAFVFEQVRDALQRPELLLRGEHALSDACSRSAGDTVRDQLGHLDRRRKAAERERRRLVDLYQADLVELGDLRTRMEEVDARLRELERERGTLAKEEAERASADRLGRSVRDFAKSVRGGLTELDFERKQRLLRLVVEEVHVQGWQVEIRLRIPLVDPDGGGGQRTAPRDQPAPVGMSSNERLRSLGDRQGPQLPAAGSGEGPEVSAPPGAGVPPPRALSGGPRRPPTRSFKPRGA